MRLVSPSVWRHSTWRSRTAVAAVAANTSTATTTATTTTATTTTATARCCFSTYEDRQRALQYDVISKSDFGPFREYSVIHTDRSLNLMSDPFQRVMRDLNHLLQTTYNAEKAVIMPGSGTFGMEAVARQFATDQHVLVIRNGWFSYRWTEIFDMGAPKHGIPASHTVLKAVPVPVQQQHAKDDMASAAHHDNPTTAAPGSGSKHTHFAPHPVHHVVDVILQERPAVVFAPHVETSTGMMLSDDYIKQVSEAVHDVGGLFVLDCIASGTVWCDMKELGIDVLITAPQKGWTGAPCAALVQLSAKAVERMRESQETSFSMSLKRWSAIMDTYEKGGFGYHTTMPTDALRDFHEISVETLQFGLPELKQAQLRMGQEARAMLNSKGLTSVAAPGAQAPGVLVYYSPESVDNPVMMNRFKEQGLQIAMGVPWKIDEPEGLKTFRIGLFGLDKLGNIDKTLSVLERALDAVLAETGHSVKVA